MIQDQSSLQVLQIEFTFHVNIGLEKIHSHPERASGIGPMEVNMKRLLLLLSLLCLLVEANHAQKIFIVQTAPTGISTASETGSIEARYEAMVALASGGASAQSTGDASEPQGDVLVHTYRYVMTGFAAALSSTQVENLRNMPDVVGVFPDRAHHPTTTHTPKLLGLKKTAGLWPETDYGKDTIIGVIDTGVWPESASFADTGLGPIPARWRGKCVTGAGWTAAKCTRKIIGARYYYAGYQAYKTSVGETIDWTKEYKSARDNQGHGTHTASTAGGRAVPDASYFGLAKGTAQGMAPKARLAVYKVCWIDGCFDSDMLAAFDNAVADGVDVISISIGSDEVEQFYQSGIAIGAYGANKRGVFVSASAGNAGPGFFTVRNESPWITTVGAGTVDREYFLNVKLGNGKVISGQSYFNGKRLVAGTVPLILASSALKGNVTAANLCYPGSLDPTKVKNKIVVCRRGGDISRVGKGQAVLDAGGAGMILANTPLFGPVLSSDAHVLPATMVSVSDSDVISSYIHNTLRPTAALLLPTITKLGMKPAPAVGIFSSRGPNLLIPALLKPDLVAPGVRILAAWPPVAELSPGDKRRSSWNIISGTSMACPHVSGAAALVKAKHRSWSPAAIRSALLTTATYLDNANGLITDANSLLPASPNEFGAGMVQPAKASDPGLIYDLSPEDYEKFLCASNLTRNQILTIDAQAKPCPAQSIRVEDFNYPSFSAYHFVKPTTSGSLTKTFRRTVTNVGPAASTYTSSFARVPADWKLSVAPRKLVFTKKNEKKTFTLTVTLPAAPVPSSGSFSFRFAFLRWSDKTRVVQSPIIGYKQTS